MGLSAAYASPLGMKGVTTPGALTWQHPEYRARWWWWEFGRVSYLGGREYLQPNALTVTFRYPVQSRNADGQLMSPSGGVSAIEADDYPSLLYRHKREEAWEYANRRARASYYNFVGPVINGLVSHATKKPAVRQGSPDLEEWWAGVDESRTTPIDGFVNAGARWAQTYGIHWACVDNDPAGDGMPYAYWVPPLDIWDWHVGADGQIDWLKQFVYGEQARPTWSSGFQVAHRMRVWYRDRVEEYAMDTVTGASKGLLSVRETGLDRVPWEPVYSQRRDDSPFPDGNPIAGDLCVVANSVYNLGSNLDEVLFDQTFAQLVIPDAGAKLDKIQVGTHRFLGYDAAGGSGAPTFISPPADNARVLMEAIGMKLVTARQAIGVGRGRSEGSMVQASADALELESEDKKAVLATIAAECEDFERRLVSLFNAYRKVDTSTDTYIQYAREFDLRALTAEIEEATSLSGLPGITEAAKARATEDIVKRRWASLPRAEMDKLLAPDLEDDTEDSAATSADNEGQSLPGEHPGKRQRRPMMPEGE